ncbi:MAG: hypothetical protein M3Y25_04840, partial [Thermoproteota archaeon]|nr:hypothetical protein [Thermoproteota archaeon]
VDYRDKIAKKTEVIITTLDQGLSLAAEFEGFGYEKVASWITPSWEDINTEITNKYYSKIPDETIKVLSELRGAHNLWYVYSKPKYKESIKQTLRSCLANENLKEIEKYDFEYVLDEVGYRYLENINIDDKRHLLWEIIFNE